MSPDRVVDSKSLKEELQKAPTQKFFGTQSEHLDKLIGGFGEGDLIIVGGSQKAGKTSLLQTWTKKFARQGVPCLWFSIELSSREFLGRFGDDLPIFYLPRVMPTNTTHIWIEKKIEEAVQAHGVKIVFIDHIGMIADEAMMSNRNSVDIMDSRLFRLKRFAVKNKVCLVAVAPFVMSSLRKKKTEPSTGDFRGTAMIGYTADTLLALDRLVGQKSIKTVNEDNDLPDFGGRLVATDAYLYVLDCRRTGARKLRIKMELDDGGDLRES